jgi:hypothetical protein
VSLPVLATVASCGYAAAMRWRYMGYGAVTERRLDAGLRGIVVSVGRLLRDVSTLFGSTL